MNEGDVVIRFAGDVSDITASLNQIQNQATGMANDVENMIAKASQSAANFVQEASGDSISSYPMQYQNYLNSIANVMRDQIRDIASTLTDLQGNKLVTSEMKTQLTNQIKRNLGALMSNLTDATNSAVDMKAVMAEVKPSMAKAFAANARD